ncbi:sulfatase-like hydrolase/transferase [Alteromonas sp. KUL49]|uniref:sulfatase family protein n=1 Tax=Alteromonas sp. KUL49 TaxID=2480798 RepID=UPI00102F2BA6|nr:sulfatase-like hydrolase/transferase [Alteromonas sp. KUL49]TAP41472.1 sulfatase [Alteromonas sp. KUL49]GEA10557.1 N-acetylgalactosamine-6-sulfatase [Alteromonas sp. KUL49]
MKIACFLIVLSVIVFANKPSASEDSRPNIIVIFADDLGYGDVGFTGSNEINTPNIDALAAGGVIFSNGYVTHPYCGPSRAGLLAGRHQARFGMEINIAHSPDDPFSGMPASEVTFPERLQDVGYTTGIVGKWHLGSHPNFHPNKHGFDYFYGFLPGGHDYFPDSVKTSTEPYHVPLERNGATAEFSEYLTTALSRDAAEFVTNTNTPFMLYLAYNAPHAPLHAPQAYIDKYTHIEDENRRIYAAMVDAMDSGIGMVVNALKQSEKLDNTLIFFLSDNGGVFPEYWNSWENWADNTPFRRGKVSLTEGGIHVPFIAYWPNQIKPNQTFDGLVSSLDIAATSVALAGGNIDKLEGVHLLPYITGERSGSPHQALFWRLEEADNIWAVRTPTTKYLNQGLPDVGLSLFDMVSDPYESNNLIGIRDDLRKPLAELWNKWNVENVNTPFLQAYPYKQQRDNFYQSLYEEGLRRAASREPYTIN